MDAESLNTAIMQEHDFDVPRFNADLGIDLDELVEHSANYAKVTGDGLHNVAAAYAMGACAALRAQRIADADLREAA